MALPPKADVGDQRSANWASEVKRILPFGVKVVMPGLGWSPRTHVAVRLHREAVEIGVRRLRPTKTPPGTRPAPWRNCPAGDRRAEQAARQRLGVIDRLRRARGRRRSGP